MSFSRSKTAPWKRGLTVMAVLASGMAAQAQVTTRKDPVGLLLNEWFEAGASAGLAAITYENRDGQHSPLNTALYPQLKVFQHDAKSGPATGPAVFIRSAPTVGNCSMSAPALKGGSVPRLYQMDPAGQQFLAAQYLSNNLILYPEHQDYDWGANGVGGGYGDLYPANNACSLISQGSSGSDQPFLQAVISAIAALPPEVQRKVIDKKVLMPVVQVLLRRSSRLVKTDEDYFTGKAHPPVFDAAQLDEEKMVRLAREMSLADIPPMVQLQVTEETELKAGQHYFEPANPHPSRLGDTPVAIARLMRGNLAEHRMTISTERSGDIMNRPLKFQWRVLSGDPAAVSIQPHPTGRYAQIQVRWQPPFLTGTGIRSHRVDIGVFATNGSNVSAPAFVTFYMPPNERHFYDAQGRVTEICYQAHNPDLGLPGNSSDKAWLSLLEGVSALREKMPAGLLTEGEQRSLRGVWLQVDKSTVTPAQTTEILSREVLSKSRLTVRAAVERVMKGLADQPDLYTRHQDRLPQAAVQSLLDLGVLQRQADGQVATVHATQELTSADRYHLQGLNLALLSQVLYPQALIRSADSAWVDTRLTVPKPWRDVLQYDPGTGALKGWVRHGGGRSAWFDAEGRHLPDGPGHPEKAVAVVYERNAQGLLEWRRK